VISTYRDGDFVDLCRGPHVPDTSWLKHFKLLSRPARTGAATPSGRCCSASTPRPSSRRRSSSSTCTASRRRSAATTACSASSSTCSSSSRAPGAAFWTPRGTTLYNTLVDFVRERQRERSSRSRRRCSSRRAVGAVGHWGKYRENMFLVLDNETGEHDMSLKPMNCPSHHLYFARRALVPRAAAALRDVRRAAPQRALGRALGAHARAPVRAGRLPRLPARGPDRRRGALPHGLHPRLLRDVRAHGDAQVRDAPRAAHRLDEMWDRAEAALRAALEATGRPYELKEGDGAFYGPKIDFDVTDSIGRAWQLGTIQLDYAAPERFDLTYVGEDNAPHRPVVIHRAVSGSFERFIAILIEHFAGAFPVWLAPEQVTVIPISPEYDAYGAAVAGALRAAGVRVASTPQHRRLPRAHPRGVGDEGAVHARARPPRGGGAHGDGAHARAARSRRRCRSTRSSRGDARRSARARSCRSATRGAEQKPAERDVRGGGRRAAAPSLVQRRASRVRVPRVHGARRASPCAPARGGL
jgi:threonyl-tRNA synthetase